jgi:hypothetical protein
MPAPANDLCASATVIASLPYSATGLDSTSATTTAGENSSWAGDGTVAGATQIYRSMWWTYTPASDERVRFELSTNSLLVAVFTGSCGSLLEVASNKRYLTVNLTGGTVYKIAVGWWLDSGTAFDFSAAISTNPGNQLQSTALDLTGLLPYTASVNLANATDANDRVVYYKYTGNPGELMIGFFAYSATTDVDVEVFADPYNIFDTNTAVPGVSAANLAIQYPVQSRTVIIRVSQFAGTAGTIDVDVQPGPTEDVPVGTIIDTDDTAGFPAAAISRSTGEVVRFVDLPFGEWGDVLDNGWMLLDDSANDAAVLFDDSFAQQVNVGTLGFDPGTSQHKIRISPGLQEFFVGRAGGGGNNASVHRVSAAGVAGTSWTLPAVGLTALAPNNDGLIVYLSGQTSSVNAPVKVWNTGSSSFGSDLIAGLGANYLCRDMLVLDDDSIVVLWLNISAGTATVKRLSAAGAVLGTYTKSSLDAQEGRLAYDYLTRETAFWVWTHLSTGHSVFEKLTAATMTVATTVPDVREYETGVFTGAETATPDARFGISQSCPFFFTRAAEDPLRPVDPSDPCCCDCPPDPGKTGVPSREPTIGATGPILPPVLAGDWTPFCAGGGVVPTAADATDAESWVS